MSDKKEVIICLGSSCFARGNKKTVQAITTYIKEHNLNDLVYFHGGHCFGLCDKGPIVKVGKTLFENVDPINVLDVLAKELEE
ncbi:MAG: (2Fe-2S) ferredoxin domain-containing protein [Salinivirgaceae bacterium]|nr:(2Fe-2S) ferredoxin domain-containing protein [Salinivirgaceae bacterium]